jgi:hypothetical protein
LKKKKTIHEEYISEKETKGKNATENDIVIQNSQACDSDSSYELNKIKLLKKWE